MSFGDILGQIMQTGLGGQTQTRDRLQRTANNLDTQGGLGGILGQLQGALQRAGVDTGSLGTSAQGFGDRARDFARSEQVGGLSGAQVGGIGALAGAILGGGGLGGAARGGAMAILGTLALNALRASQANRSGAASPAPVEESEVRALTGPVSEKLALRAMIAAAKADGQIDQTEMQKIVGKISGEGVTAEEKQFVLEEMARPLDIAALAAEARDPAQAAQVYAASILAIDVDTEQERVYLHELAAALGLDDAAVAQLHKMTGVPV